MPPNTPALSAKNKFVDLPTKPTEASATRIDAPVASDRDIVPLFIKQKKKWRNYCRSL